MTQSPENPRQYNSTEDASSGIVNQAEAYARREPSQALGVAFFAGLILTILPVGRILAGLLRLAFVLLRPALVIFGAVKAYEEFNHRQQD